MALITSDCAPFSGRSALVRLELEQLQLRQVPRHHGTTPIRARTRNASAAAAAAASRSACPPQRRHTAERPQDTPRATFCNGSHPLVQRLCKIQISRRYNILPQVHSLTKHV